MYKLSLLSLLFLGLSLPAHAITKCETLLVGGTIFWTSPKRSKLSLDELNSITKQFDPARTLNSDLIEYLHRPPIVEVKDAKTASREFYRQMLLFSVFKNWIGTEKIDSTPLAARASLGHHAYVGLLEFIDLTRGLLEKVDASKEPEKAADLQEHLKLLNGNLREIEREYLDPVEWLMAERLTDLLIDVVQVVDANSKIKRKEALKKLTSSLYFSATRIFLQKSVKEMGNASQKQLKEWGEVIVLAISASAVLDSSKRMNMMDADLSLAYYFNWFFQYGIPADVTNYLKAQGRRSSSATLDGDKAL